MSQTELETMGYAWLVRKVRERLGIDLAQYRPEQVQRRLEGLRGRLANDNYFSLAGRLERDPVFAEHVRDQLTVNVSEFFRDGEHFGRLAREVLPRLAGRHARLWSAGCSLGAEAYSLAILALEAGLFDVTIWATDIDPRSLEQARAGIYRPEELRGLDGARQARWMRPVEPDRVTFRPEVKRLVRVERHNLLADPFPADWDVILCRNVVIYFTPEARTALYQRFRDALRVGGVLFTGASESVPNSHAIGLELVAPFFYRRSTGKEESA